MRHIEIILTDLDIEVNMAVLKAQKETLESFVREGKIKAEDLDYTRKLISSVNSLWHKFNWALNPKAVK